MSTSPIPAEKLRLRCDPSQLAFETTAELAEVGDILGQGRAHEAVRFGIGIRSDGHNLFVMGPPGTGKYSTVSRLVGAARRGNERSLSYASWQLIIESDWMLVQAVPAPSTSP